MCLITSKLFLFLSLQCTCILCLFNEHLSIIENTNQILSFGDDKTEVVYHAFVQIGLELKHFKDITYQDSVLLPSDLHSKSKLRLFDEEVTDFGITTVGVIVHKVINLTNPGDSTIIISNIISSGINFHCSISYEEKLPSKERTSFNIYFLPTTEEPSLKEEILSFFTSLGKFEHKVRGQVNGNSFRLKPLLNIRLPINSTFPSPIYLHNPYSQIIKLMEIFSSDCNIHLEFPKENLINFTKNSLNSILLPFETRKIAIAKILGNVERNTTSFIFIRFKLIKRTENNIYIPSFPFNSETNLITILIETQVTVRRDIFSTVNLLDFGYVEASKQFLFPLKLSVFSTLERSVEIDQIYSDKSEQVYFQYETHPPILLKSSARGQPGLPVDIARININTFIDDRTATNKTTKVGRMFLRSGNIIALSRGGNYNVTVPFSAKVYEGGIEYNLNELSFLKNLNFLQREIILTNLLPFSLAIFGAEIEENGKEIFEVSLIESPIIISSGQSLPSLIILFKNAAIYSLNFSSSQINLKTNLTNFHLPLYIFNGELNITLNSIEQNIFNFGIITAGEIRSIFFTLSNQNPISIEIIKFHIPTQFSNFISIQLINQTNNEQQNFINKKLSNFLISSHSSSLFKMSLNCLQYTSFNKSKFSELFSIKTIFSSYNFLINFEISNSTILFSIPKKIFFKEAFVGGVYTKSLNLMSSLLLQPLRISFLNKDKRFSLSITNKLNKTTKLKPWIEQNIANISFIPGAVCPQKDCYLGIPINSEDGQWFSYGMKLPQELAEIDRYLFSRLRDKWSELKEKSIKSIVKVDTDKIRGFEIPIEANLIWPKLFSHSTVHFPLTAVGNFSIVNLTISNPTTLPVIIQILPLVIYPDSDRLLQFLSEELLLDPLIDPIELNETLMFSLRDTELFTLRPGSPTPKLREEVEKIIEGPIPRFTLSLLLRPGMNVRVRIGFLPSDYRLRSSMMIIRNNLTVIEPVVLYGRGARINIEIDNKTCGGNSKPLLFELEQHLSDCANPQRQLHKKTTTPLTVRRFAVHNNGEVGFNVVNISISGSPCENRGFRVLNCERFRLEPNETTYLYISYTPDFLFSVNEASLQIFMHMNNTPWSFILAAVVPKHLLSMCHSALPRPPFEALMNQTCVLALMFCLICMISCAYLEGDRVVLFAYKQQFLQKQQKGGVFNKNNELLKSNTKVLIDDFGIEVNDLYKREFKKISSDANIFQRVFWNTLNFILWIFSYVWPFLRREKSTTLKTNKPLPVIEIDREHDDVGTLPSIKSPINIKNNQLLQQQQQQQTLTNKELTIINRISKNKNVSQTSSDEKIQKRTIKTKENKINNVEQQQENKKHQQINQTNKTNNKTFNIKTSNKENINEFSDEKLRRQYISVSSSSSGEAITNDSDLFNDITRNNVFNIRRKTSTSEDEIGQQNKWKKHLYNENKNNNKINVLNSYDAEEETSAESEIPEWADEDEFGKCDIDEDFEQLATKSAQLFDASKGDDNNEDQQLFYLTNKIFTNNFDNENNLKLDSKISKNVQIEKLIEKLTNEYRERLLRIYKGESHFDIGLTLPSDLSPNIGGNEENEYLNFSNNVNNPENQLKRRSPGGDVKIKNKKIIEENKTTKNIQSGFLFNIEDPVWKPLSEYDGLPDWSKYINNKKE